MDFDNRTAKAAARQAVAIKIPRRVRASAFAGAELLLDVFRDATAHYQLDLEAIWILLAIGHETMRPWILDPKLAEMHISDLKVPDSVRGSVSRRMVADRTNLPRETVRRRIAELVERGLVISDEKGMVRLTGDRLADPKMQEMLSNLVRMVERFQERVASLGAEHR